MDLDVQLADDLSSIKEILSRPNDWLSPPVGPFGARSLSAIIAVGDDAQKAIYRFARDPTTSARGSAMAAATGDTAVRILLVEGQVIEWPSDAFIYTEQYDDSLYEQNREFLTKNSLYLKTWRVMQLTPDADDLLRLVQRTGCNYVSIGKAGRWVEFITLRGNDEYQEVDCEGRFALVVRKTHHKSKKPIAGIPDYLQDTIEELSLALRRRLREEDLVYKATPKERGFKSFGTLHIRLLTQRELGGATGF